MFFRLTNTPYGELFFKFDQLFNQPRAIIKAKFVVPWIYERIENDVCLHLFLACLRHQMKEDTYPAETANLDCSLNTEERGFSIEVKGINDKLEILLQTVLNHFEAFEDNLEDNHFEALLKQKKKDYYNVLINPSNLSYDVKQFMRRDVYR